MEWVQTELANSVQWGFNKDEPTEWKTTRHWIKIISEVLKSAMYTTSNIQEGKDILTSYDVSIISDMTHITSESEQLDNYYSYN